MEKTAKYQELAVDLASQWQGARVKVVAVVVGDLGTIANMRKNLLATGLYAKPEVESVIESMQRETLCANVKRIKRLFISKL